MCKSLYEHILSFNLVKSTSGMTGTCRRCMFTILKSFQIIFPSGCKYHIYQQSKRVPFFHILTNTNYSYYYLFNFSHSSKCILVFLCSFNLFFLITSDVGHLFMCLFTINISSLVKCLFKSFAYLYWFFSSNNELLRVLYMF